MRFFDQYWELSIKAGERKKRGEASALEVRIHGTSTLVPKKFQKYISNAANKVRLSAFLTEVSVEMAKHLLPAEKELVIGGGTMDGNAALSIKNGHCHKSLITRRSIQICCFTPNTPVRVRRGSLFSPLILMCYFFASRIVTRSELRAEVSHWGEGSSAVYSSQQDCS